MILGKLIGGFFGALFFHFFGGILGIAIGHCFDQGLHLHFSNSFLNNTASAQHAFFSATFSVMGHIAKADGKVSQEEIEFAERIMGSIGAKNNLRKEAIRYFTLGKSANFNLEVTLDQLVRFCNSPALLQVFVEIQQQIVDLEGRNPAKLRIMQVIYQKLGIPGETKSSQQQQYRQHTRPEPSTTLSPYQILNVSPTATHKQIKLAYRKLMSVNHPDKLVSQGLPTSMIKIATEKTQKIQAAYDEICKQRGF